MWKLAKIDATFKDMKSKGYVPFLRFGKYVVQVRAAADITYEGKKYKKGRVVSWEAFDHQWEQENARARASRRRVRLPRRQEPDERA